jgi:hypothetical protein
MINWLRKLFKKQENSVKLNNTGDSLTEVQFTCACEKGVGWIAKDRLTEPCPYCGRMYIGKYNPKTYTIDTVEVSEYWVACQDWGGGE